MYYNKFLAQTINSFEMRWDGRRWVRWDDAHIILALQEAHQYFLISKDRTIHYHVRKKKTQCTGWFNTLPLCHSNLLHQIYKLCTYIHVHPVYTRN